MDEIKKMLDEEEERARSEVSIYLPFLHLLCNWYYYYKPHVYLRTLMFILKTNI